MYEINDTLLFNKEGVLETVIIDLVGKQKYTMLWILDDFGFCMLNRQLKGWVLRKASEHIYIGEEHSKEISPHILMKYFNALNLWEESEDLTELENLAREGQTCGCEFCRALWELCRTIKPD